MKQQEEKPQMFATLRMVYDWVALICQCLPKPVEVFLRERPGTHYFRIQFGIGLLIYAAIYTYTLCAMKFPEPWFSEIALFGVFCGVVSILAATYHRHEALKSFHRGEVRHRFYFGDSVFSRWFSDGFAKHWVEPLVCFAAGIACVMFVSPPMTIYLFLAGACLKGNYEESQKRIDVRVQAQQDAMIEQQVIAERLRR